MLLYFAVVSWSSTSAQKGIGIGKSRNFKIFAPKFESVNHFLIFSPNILKIWCSSQNVLKKL